jgi:hypothetical protein
MNDIAKPKGIVSIEIRDKDGNLKYSETGENIITYVGKAAMAALVGNVSSPVAFTYLAVGSSATAAAATDTALGSEITMNGLARASATVMQITTTQTNDTLKLTYTWTATGTQAVNEVGIFNAASIGTLLAHYVFTSTKNLSSTDQLIIVYTVQFT